MNAPAEPIAPGEVRERFRHIGTSLPRREDRRLLTGTARFVDDIEIPGALHACFVRSPHAHARITGIDTGAAAAHAGVIAVVTGEMLAAVTNRLVMAPPIEGLLATEIETLPTSKVRFQGDPVACVIATDRYIAEDAAELVEVGYEVLDAVVSIASALAPGAARVDESLPSNLVSHQRARFGDPDGAARRAVRTVEAEFEQPRLTHAPIETRGCIAVWDPGREHLTMHTGNQVPHPFRTQLAARLRLLEHQVTVISPDIGGGFGQKIAVYREELTIAAIARMLARPVRWREDRMENLASAAHARETHCRTQAAVDAEGRVLALTLAITEDFGAYCFYPANYIARVVAMILTGPYRIRDYAYEVKAVLTNKCGSAPMRAPMAITSWVMEGTLDAVARALGLDPVAVRRVNMLEAAELPWTMPTGEVLAEVSPRATMDAVLGAIDYAAFRARQHEARGRGRWLGLGVCNVIESTTYGSAFYKAAGIAGSGHESAWLRIEPSGVVNASVGLMGSGQSYETPFTQIVAEALGIDPRFVRIHTGNTDVAPYGMGSRGSRGGTAGGSVLWLAGLDARVRILAIAAHRLRVPALELRVADGRIERRQGGDWESAGLTFAEVARSAYLDPLALPPGIPPGLEFVRAYDPPAMTYSNAAHACEVEVEEATGAVRILRYVVAEDCGTVINPPVVEGQQHGAVAMGLGGALYEHARYDEQGQNVAATFADYLLPTATEVPDIEVIGCHTPGRATPLGIKGMAEGGVMGAIGAIGLAVNDAIAPFGVVATRQPFTPVVIRALLRGRPAARFGPMSGADRAGDA